VADDRSNRKTKELERPIEHLCVARFSCIYSCARNQSQIGALWR